MALTGCASENTVLHALKSMTGYSLFWVGIIAAMMALFAAGCASPVTQQDVLAYVDGDPVTSADLEYALEVTHRREDLSTARSLDIDSYLEKLIDERLIVQEARRMGMEDHQAVREKVDAFILRESVMQLYQDEVLGKVSLTDNEVKAYYRDNYEQYVIDVVESKSVATSASIAAALQSGALFDDLAKQYPDSVFTGGEEGNPVARKSLPDPLALAVEGLQPGTWSNTVPLGERFYLVRLVSRVDAPMDEYDSTKASIESLLRKTKVDEQSGAYLEQLRSGADLNIDREVMSSIIFTPGNRDRWLQDARPVVTVDGKVLTVGGLVGMLPADDEGAKELVVKKWLDRKLVDIEALRHEYALLPPLRDRVTSYQNRLIYNVFSKEVIAAEIEISEDDVQEFYERNREHYMRPMTYKIQQISLRTPEDAEAVRTSLEQGASFAWLARNRSVDAHAAEGGLVGWKIKDNLRAPVKEIIDTMEQGEISPVLQIDSNFVVIRLMEKSEKQVEELDRVRDLVMRGVRRDKFLERYTDLVGTLRKKADIEIMKDAVSTFEEKFK